MDRHRSFKKPTMVAEDYLKELYGAETDANPAFPYNRDR